MEVATGIEPGARHGRSCDAHLAEYIAPNITLLAIADGFGVHPRNVPVAQTALGIVRDYLRRRHRVGSYGRHASPGNLRATLLSALDHANARLFADGGTHDDYVGSGTSLTAVLVAGDHAFVGHVGDARAYLMRFGSLEMLTVDDAVFAGAPVVPSALPEFAPTARPLGLLWRSLGTQAKLEASVAHIELRSDDQLVLCTSGVHRHVSDGEIGSALVDAQTSSSAVARLLSLTRLRGASDRGTLIVCRNVLQAAPAKLARISSTRLQAIAIAALIVVSLLAVGLVALRTGGFDRIQDFSNSDRR